MSDHKFRGRREDLRLLTGQGRYTADYDFNGQVAGHFLRADRAHAKIARIDTAAARKLPGVLDILTGADLVATGWKGAPAMSFFKGVGGSSLRVPFRTGLAHERVRFVGEPVALVVAESEYIAQDAAELIAIEYEDLPAAGHGRAMPSPMAPSVCMTNCPTIWRSTTSTATRRPPSRALPRRPMSFASSCTRSGFPAIRWSRNPARRSMTPRMNTFEICIPTQGTGDLKAALSQITGLAPEKFRIRSADVGGGFGVRHEVYPEFLAVMLAAKRTGKPVRWLGTRSETISGDHHGRAADLIGELALDSKGQFLALRVQWLVNLGAFCSNSGPLINTIAAPTSSAISLYNVPAVHGRHRLVFTNTTPTTAYRGAGRPNVAYLWERLVEEAALATGINSIKLRRRNVLRKNVFPMKTPTGSTYDSGDPARLLDTALKASDWDGFEKRRKAAKREGKLRGIGLALFLEPSGGMGKEQVELRVEPDGRLSMFSLAGPSGQGHETVYPALVADILGVSRGQDRPALQRCEYAEAHRRRHLRLALADQPRRCACQGRQGNRRKGQGARGAPVRGRGR